MSPTAFYQQKSLFLLWVYLIACVLPVFRADDTPGYTALLMGWMGILGDWPVFFSWLANLFYFAAYLVPAGKRNTRFVLSVVSILLGLCFFGVKEIPESEAGQAILVEPGIGCWLWLESFLYLFMEILLKKPAVST